MSIYPTYIPQRPADSLNLFGYYALPDVEPDGYYSSTTTINGVTFYTPPRPLVTRPGHHFPRSPSNFITRFPDPPEGSKPPAAWEEWERNSNWPLPANLPKPKQASRAATPKPSAAASNANNALQLELDRNANWPLPATKLRKRTNSQSKTAPRPRKLSFNERVEFNGTDTNSNFSIPMGAPRKPAEPVIPLTTLTLDDVVPDASKTAVNPLLARDSPKLVRFDLRLPHTSVRKQVRDTHWTHLNHDDLRQPAARPHRTQMRIYTMIPGTEGWVANVLPKSRPYVTVGDVLMAVYETFNAPVDTRLWARDSVNPTLADRALRAYRRRAGNARMIGNDKSRQEGLRRVDYLGSKYCFSGIMLCFAEDNSEWWLMQLVPEER